nr:flagellar protein FlgN [Desulfobacula sp.]
MLKGEPNGKIAHKIEELLQEKLSLYQELQRILELEKTYVVKMDIDSLWVTISQKKALALAIEDIRQNIIRVLGGSSPSTDDKAPGLSRMIRRVLPEKRAELEKIHLAIDTCKKEIARQASDNKKLYPGISFRD